MSIKKFIESVIQSLDLDEFEKKGKKKSLKRLLKKLEERRMTLHNTEKKYLTKKEKKELKEELAIIMLQIEKGNKLLESLNAQNQENTKES